LIRRFFGGPGWYDLMVFLVGYLVGCLHIWIGLFSGFGCWLVWFGFFYWVG
jgi:hypothetical protein